MHIYIYIYVCVCVYTHAQYKCVNAYVYILHTYTHTQTYVHKQTYKHKNTDLHTYINTYAHTHTHTHIPSNRKYAYTHRQTTERANDHIVKRRWAITEIIRDSNSYPTKLETFPSKDKEVRTWWIFCIRVNGNILLR